MTALLWTALVFLVVQGILSALLQAEALGLARDLSHALVLAASRRLPVEFRNRYLEEWASELQELLDRPRPLSAFWYAAGCWFSAPGVARAWKAIPPATRLGTMVWRAAHHIGDILLLTARLLRVRWGTDITIAVGVALALSTSYTRSLRAGITAWFICVFGVLLMLGYLYRTLDRNTEIGWGNTLLWWRERRQITRLAGLLRSSGREARPLLGTLTKNLDGMNTQAQIVWTYVDRPEMAVDNEEMVAAASADLREAVTAALRASQLLGLSTATVQIRAIQRSAHKRDWSWNGYTASRAVNAIRMVRTNTTRIVALAHARAGLTATSNVGNRPLAPPEA